MEFTCSRQALQGAVGLLSSIVPARSTKPILQNIRIDGAGKNLVELAATDLDVGLKLRVEATSLSDPSAVVLPAGQLAGIVRDAWGEEVTVQADGERAKILTESASFEVLGEPAEEFPEIPDLDEDAAVQMCAADLAGAIAQTQFATAREEEGRYSLAGLYVALEKKQAELAATDTFRLAVSRRPLRAAVDEPASAIVLSKGMSNLAKLLANEEVVNLQISENQFFAQTASATLVSRLIEGKFPQYTNVIPKDLDKMVRVNRDRFMQALRQASVLANEETHAVQFQAGDGKLVLQSGSGQGAGARVEVDAQVQGDEVSVSFNYLYFLDVLKVLAADEVVISLRDRESPARIDGKDYVYVVSPICPRDA